MMHLLLLTLAMGLAQNTEAILFSSKKPVVFGSPVLDATLTNSDVRKNYGVDSNAATAIIGQFDRDDDGILSKSEYSTCPAMSLFARLKNDRDSGIKTDLGDILSVTINLGGSAGVSPVFSDDDFKALIANDILANSDLKNYFGVTMDVANVIIAQFDSNVDGVLDRSEFTTPRCMTAFNRLKNDRDNGIEIDLERLFDLNINHVFSDEDFKNRIANGKLTDSDLRIYFGVTPDVATAIIAKLDSNGDGFLVRSEYTTARCMAALARLKCDRDNGIKIDLDRSKLLLDLNIKSVFSDVDFKNRIANGKLRTSDLEDYFGVTSDVATAFIAQFDRNGDGGLVRPEFTTARCTTAFGRLKNDRDNGKKIDLERLLELNINSVFSDENFKKRIIDGTLTNSDLKKYFGMPLNVAVVIIALLDSNVDGVLVRSEFTTARCMTAFGRLKNARDSDIKIDLESLLDLNINHVFSDEDFKNLIANGRLTDSDLENYFGVTFDVATAIIAQFDRNGDGELVRSEFTTGRCMAAFARLKNDRDSNINIDLERIKFVLDLNGDQVGQCRNVRCLNNGSCERGICKCTPGYSGDDCRMNLCEINSCPGDTPCVPIIVPNGYVCSCVERLSINQLTSVPRCDARRIITPIYVYGKSQNFVSGISGVPGKKLVISFIDDFGIGSTDSCFNDYLQIAGKKYCGNKAPADIMLSTGLGTQVRFVTGRINQNVGYTFTYQYIDDIPDNNPCKNGGTRTSSETCTCRTGFLGPTCQNTPLITSPGINKKQETTFNLLGSPGKELVLAFNDYFRTPGTNSIDCSKDYVEIGNNRYCGNRAAPSPITIPTGRGTTVVFKCSGEISYRTKLSHVYTET